MAASLCQSKLCKCCQKAYKPTSNVQVLCITCRTVVCTGCGKTIFQKRLKHTKKPFCSSQCFYKNRSNQYSPWNKGKKTGIPSWNRGKQGLSGSKNPAWKGGRFKTKSGYVFIHAPNHPRAVRNRILEHILIAERKIGRPLLDNEIVHHVNEVKHDNRPENLQVTTRSEHMKHHDPILKYLQKRFPAAFSALGHSLSDGRIRVRVEELR